jgi:hypothetical protein
MEYFRMTETLAQMEARHAAERAALEARENLVHEAIEIVVNDGINRTAAQTAAIRERRAGHEKVNIALAALRRGMELAALPLAPAEPVDEEWIERTAFGVVQQAYSHVEKDYRGRRYQIAANAIRATLAHRGARWPGEAELREMALQSCRKADFSFALPYEAALEMARRLRAYQTGDQA